MAQMQQAPSPTSKPSMTPTPAFFSGCQACLQTSDALLEARQVTYGDAAPQGAVPGRFPGTPNVLGNNQTLPHLTGVQIAILLFSVLFTHSLGSRESSCPIFFCPHPTWGTFLNIFMTRSFHPSHFCSLNPLQFPEIFLVIVSGDCKLCHHSYFHFFQMP